MFATDAELHLMGRRILGLCLELCSTQCVSCQTLVAPLLL